MLSLGWWLKVRSEFLFPTEDSKYNILRCELSYFNYTVICAMFFTDII